MRNTLMQDKLSALLLSQPTSHSPISPKTELMIERAAQYAKRTSPKRKSGVHPVLNANPFKSLAAKPQTSDQPVSRYITPPKKQKPFSVHVYPIDSVVEPEPETKEEVAKPEVVSVKEVQKEVKVEKTEVEPSVAEQKIPLSPVLDSKPESVVVAPAVEAPQETPELVFPELKEIAEPTIPVAETVSPEESHEVPESPVSEKAPESVQEENQSIESQPVIAMPPNLQWLDQSTPFGDYLRLIVDKLRTAKTNAAFTLEQSVKRQNELKKQIESLQKTLYQEEFVGEQQREYLRQADETIAACALVAEQSSGIKDLLKELHSPAHKSSENAVKRTYRRYADSETCHRDDVVKIFANNPNRKWSHPEIVNELPASKRAHGKQYVYALLSTLTKEEIIKRIAPGIYVSNK